MFLMCWILSPMPMKLIMSEFTFRVDDFDFRHKLLFCCKNEAVENTLLKVTSY